MVDLPVRFTISPILPGDFCQPGFGMPISYRPMIRLSGLLFSPEQVASPGLA